MCGRYQASLPPEALARYFGVRGPLPNWPPRWNAAPTDSHPVIRFNAETGERRLDLLRWGLIAHFAKDETIGPKRINAQAETAAVKPAFRDGVRKRRCIVPAGGFYEWAKERAGKQPYAVALASGEPMAFAGLWSNWKNAAGEWVRSYAILTCAANPLLRPIHQRMPAVLDPADHARWLGEQAATADELQALLRPYPAERMRVWKVSSRVGNVRNDDAGLWDPIL